MTEALPGEDADFDFRLIEPTSMNRRVVNREAVRYLAAKFRGVEIGQGLALMDVQIVQDQMDGLRCRVLQGQLEGYLRELQGRTIRRREGEMAACFGFYCAENISRPATLVLVVPSRFPSWRRRRAGTDIGMGGDGLLIPAPQGLWGIEGFLILLQTLLHFFDVVFIEFAHAPHFFPATA